MPDKLEKMKAPFWINPAAVSLSVELWERDGLFKAKEGPRDYSDIERQIRSLYAFHNNKNVTGATRLENPACKPEIA
jgi:hypothetical protein